MPLIDDQTKGTDQHHGTAQRSKPYWPWVLVLVGFVILWLAFTTLVTVMPQLQRPQSAPAVAPTAQQQFQRNLVTQAQSTLSAGNVAAADKLIDQIPPGAALDVMAKHTYFRTAAQVKRKAGDPAAAAGLYERFLSMGVSVGNPECQSCHAAGSIPPARAADLQASSLGTEYVAALRAAGKLKGTRKRLLDDLRKQRDQPRTHLLVYHVEKALGNARAAVEHAEALK